MYRSIVNSSIGKTVAVSALCIALASCSGSEDRQQKYLERANEYYDQENLDKARIEVKNVLQINPKNVEARVLLARLHQSAGEFREAFMNFNAAVEENPDHVQARVGLARLYYAARENVSSREHVDKALALAPDNREARILSAGLHDREGNWEQALKIAEAVLEEYPGDDGAIAVITSIYVNADPQKALDVIEEGIQSKPKNETLKNLKLTVLSQMGDAEGVEALLKELVEEHPHVLDYHFRLARGYAFQNRLDEAEAILTNALELNPDNIEAQTSYIEFLAQRRGLESAEENIKFYIDQNPEIYRYKDILAQLYLGAQRVDDAKAVYQSVIDADGTSADSLQARNALASLHLALGERGEAEILLSDIFAIEAANTQGLISRARIHLADGLMEDATADLRAALKNDAENLEALKLLALAQERNGTPDLALESYRRAIDVDSRDLDSLVSAGRLSMGNNQLDAGERFLNRALQVNPQHAQAMTLLSQLYVAQKKWEKAIDVADRMIAIDAVAAAGHVLKAGAYRAQDDWSNARTHYQQALELSPKSFESVGGYVDTYLIEKDYDGAIEFLQSHLEEYPDLLFAQDILATVYNRADQIDESIKIYREIIEQNPNIEATYQKLAAIYVNGNDLATAESIYKRGLEHNAGFVSLRAYLANIYQQQENYKQAKEQYEVILSAQPDNQIVRNNLAVLLVNNFPSEANFQRALELAADFSRSKQPVFLDTLGWTHYHLGNLPQAISYLEASVNRGQNKAEYHYHLGMAYHKNGENEKAKEQLNLAVQSEGEKYYGIEEALATLELL